MGQFAWRLLDDDLFPIDTNLSTGSDECALLIPKENLDSDQIAFQFAAVHFGEFCVRPGGIDLIAKGKGLHSGKVNRVIKTASVGLFYLKRDRELLRPYIELPINDDGAPHALGDSCLLTHPRRIRAKIFKI